MAITPIRTAQYVSVPFSDSRAAGYVTTFTAQGWDQWRQAVESLGQVVADNQKDYESKLKAYEALSKAVMDKRSDLSKKIADIAAKKGDLIGKYQQKNAELAQKAARDAAQIPSTRVSSSGRWAVSEGRTLWNPKYKPEDGGTTPSPKVVDPTLLENAKSISGATDMSPEERRTEIAAAAKATGGYNDVEAADFADSFLKDASFVSGMGVAPSQAEAGRRASRSAGGSTSTSVGQTWREYQPSTIDIQKDPAIQEYDKALKDLQAQLSASGLDMSNLVAPVLEPVDLITTARSIYKEKFGDVPVATNLKVDGRSVAVLNNLMPFEVTNGMKKSVDFFKRYIDDSVLTARRAAISAGKEFTTNDLNLAVEEGKRKAREVLFGGAIGDLAGKTATEEGDPNSLKFKSATPIDIAVEGLKAPTIQYPVRDQLAELSGMERGGPPKVAPIPTPTPKGTSWQEPSLGRKVEGEIPTYPATSPPEAAPKGPATLPYNLPEGGMKEFPGRGLEWTEPRPQWMPKVQPGLMRDKSAPTEYIEETIPAYYKEKARKVKSSEEKDKEAKTEAFITGTKAATNSPSQTAKAIVSDSIGKYVATVFDENKAKGASAKPVSAVTEQLIREYSGQPEKQKKAIQRYVELSTLDANSKRIG